MKKSWILCILLPMLFGCSYHKITSETPAPEQRLCSDLKRNITFNSTFSTNLWQASATQKAEMMRSYDQHNCSRFEIKQ